MTQSGIRVATYNIHGCFGLDGRYAPDRVAAVIADMAPDILALQEVDNRRPWHEGFHQFDYLRHRTGMSGIPGASIVEERGEYGNALFTRLPVVSIQRIDLSVPAREPRGAIDAVLQAPEGRIRVIATHLGLKPWERRVQIDRLLETVTRPVGVDATLLVGDLNEWLPRGFRLRAVTERFARGYTAPTWPAHMPLLSLDRIYALPHPAHALARVHDGALARRASDHLPLSVDLAW